MSILNIKAAIECDGCGDQFRIELDEAQKLSATFSMADLVEDNLRGGSQVEPIGKSARGFSSYQGGRMLCPACTKKCDDFIEEDRNLTDDEVTQALGYSL